MPHRRSADEVHYLERHETAANAVGGRTLRDLGDCLFLYTEDEREPFGNRVGALRWPSAPAAFDARLAEILALFAVHERRPHVWTAPDHREPSDVEARLAANGFTARTGAYVMVADREPPASVPGPEVTVERWGGGPEAPLPATLLREVAALKRRSFDGHPAGIEELAARTARVLATPGCTLVLVREEGRPVAVGQGFTFDGATYLASIGTDPAATGRGHGTLVTSTLIRDARAAGSRLVHLAVYAGNDRAIGLYRRCGMEPIGEAGELLLAG